MHLGSHLYDEPCEVDGSLSLGSNVFPSPEYDEPYNSPAFVMTSPIPPVYDEPCNSDHGSDASSLAPSAYDEPYANLAGWGMLGGAGSPCTTLMMGLMSMNHRHRPLVRHPLHFMFE